MYRQAPDDRRQSRAASQPKPTPERTCLGASASGVSSDAARRQLRSPEYHLCQVWQAVLIWINKWRRIGQALAAVANAEESMARRCRISLQTSASGAAVAV